MTWLDALGSLIGLLSGFGSVGPASLVTGTVTAAIMLLAAALAMRTLLVRTRAEGADPRARSRALRAQSTRIGVPRHRDPDSSGHARPRAPSAAQTAA